MKENLGSVVIPEFTTSSGAVIKNLVQTYACYGKPDGEQNNVILVCHALTGSHRLAGDRTAGQPEPWWPALAGDGKALDTRKYFVICFNNLASPYGSTSPMTLATETGKRWGMDFPILSPRDVARAQKAALEQLGVNKILMTIGASLGGMIAVEVALTFPGDVGSCVLIAAPDKLYPQAIAFNAVQRQSIISDPKWRNGEYDGVGPADGLAAARMLAMITYRSEQSFAGRYMRDMAKGSAQDWTGRFKVEEYLFHHGQQIVKRFDANCYLYLTRMMDLHDIGAERNGIKDAWARFAGKKLLAVGISSDMLFANWQVEEASRTAREAGVLAYYDEIESDNGHDAFLIDSDQLDDMIRGFLSDGPREKQNTRHKADFNAK